MLTPEELISLVETMHPLLDELNQWITADLIKRLLARLAQGEAFLTATDDWQVQVYQEAGGHLEALQRELARWTKLCDKEVQRIFEDAGIKALTRDNAFYEARGLESFSITQSEGMLRLLEDSYQRTAGTIHNFTRTTATMQTTQLNCTKTKSIWQAGSTAPSEAICGCWPKQTSKK